MDNKNWLDRLRRSARRGECIPCPACDHEHTCSICLMLQNDCNKENDD